MSNYWTQPVNRRSASFGAACGLAASALVIVGQPAAGAAVLLTAFSSVLGLQWMARHLHRTAAARQAAAGQAQVRTHRLQEAVKIRHNQRDVWELLVDPDNAAVLGRKVARSYVVPGTPSGIGQQRATTDLDGNVTVDEIIEYQEGHRLVSRLVSPPLPTPVRFTCNLQAVGDACILTCGLEYDAPADATLPHSEQSAWRVEVQDFFTRVKATLADVDGQEARHLRSDFDEHPRSEPATSTNP